MTLSSIVEYTKWTRQTKSGTRNQEGKALGINLRTGVSVLVNKESLFTQRECVETATPIVGPFKIVKSHPATSNYTLDLPEESKAQHIHPMFHVSLLRPHEVNDTQLFPHQDPIMFYDFGQTTSNGLWTKSLGIDGREDRFSF